MRGQSPVQPRSVAAGIEQGALPIDLDAATLSRPVRFELGFRHGTGHAGRLPRSGQLVWDGRSAARLPATGPVPAQTAAGILNPTALAGACRSIPRGTVPPFLTLSGLSSGAQPDPRARAASRAVSAGLAASPIGVTTPFAIGAVVLRAGAARPGSRP